MNDKERQILAITQDLSDCLEYDIEDSSVVDTYDTAYKLANKGWVKLLDDSVVLTREEYEVLKIKEKEKHWLQTCMSIWKNAKIDSSKETAEKILNELYVQFSADYLVGLRNEYKDWKYADLIKRYAKQFGCEIKE